MERLVRRFGVVMVMLVVAALLVVAGIHNMRSRRAEMQSKQQVILTKEGEAAPANGQASTMDSVMGPSLRGKMAPGFTLVDTTGKKVSLADFKGHPVVINFWATYCGPCKLEMPWFEEFSHKYQADGLIVLGVDQDEDMPTEKIAAAAKKIGASYPILMPDKKIAGNYSLGDYLPETFYVNKSGNIVEQSVGAPPKDEMEANVRKAISE